LATRTTDGPAPSVSICKAADRPFLLWSAILASAMGFIDGSVTAVAIPSMRAGLGASLAEAQWFSVGYLLTLSALVLTGGALGDRYGTARVFRWGIAAFIAASLACAAAQDPLQMILARAVKGAAAALMVPGSMALVAKAYPRSERGRALGLWAAASTATTAFGPVLGGILLSTMGDAGWRLIFGLNLPLGLIALGLLAGRTAGDAGDRSRRLDLAGAALATLGLGALSYGLIALGTAAAPFWIAAGTVALGAFLVWEAMSPAPMLRLGLFRNRVFSLMNLATFLLYAALGAIMFYLPMTAISAWGVVEWEVTAAFLPVSLLIGLLSAPAGRLADRYGAARLVAGGAALVALAYLVLAGVAVRGAFWSEVLPCFVLSGIGLGLAVAPLTAAVMAAAGDAEQGVASGVNNAVARISGLVAIAVLGGIAATAYGPVADGLPGFGLTAGDAAHRTATGRAFRLIAAAAGLAALLAAGAALSARPGPLART
jgi:EmrB/QacA subfamily drug resistance transporter